MEGIPVAFSQQAVTDVWPYFFAIVALTIFTVLYTAKGGIKAVIWTDVVQACLMFGSAIVAIITLLNHVGGMGEVVKAVPALTNHEGYWVTGFEPHLVSEWQTANKVTTMGFWDYIKMIFTSDYTILSALFGATAMNMAMFGTDQDMVQRMLTAETYKKARRSLMTAAFADIPIAAVFTFIGILLYVYYQKDPTYKPAANSDIFGSYILNVMPVGVRGLVLAGIFATAMGSFSAALNALATSAVNDWYIPRYPHHKEEAHYVGVAKWFTVIFAILMVIVATFFAFLKVHNPNIRIIPLVLGIAGYIVGPMLGVFLLGMFTKNRGSDSGNLVAVVVGLIVTGIVGDLPSRLTNEKISIVKSWGIPAIEFTWWALIGAVVVFLVGMCFQTPPDVLARAKRKEETGEGVQDERPIFLREEEINR